MNVTVVYLISRFFYRIIEFARHWYVKSFRIYFDRVFSVFHALDRVFAWKITAENLLKPLYQDYSIVGYIMGFFFRSLRLLGASAAYAVIFAVAAGLYLVWLLIPVYFVYTALR